ncbi:MAG: sigma 54-interacting transcriptional regulator [Chloroflexota bacterium]
MTDRIDQPESPARPATLGELRAAGYRSRSVKQELRANLLRALAQGDAVFEGIVGYEQSVIPAIQNAVIAGQDIVLLGERGQAKTRLARALGSLLDDAIPVVAASELHEDPLAPITAATRDLIATQGDRTPIDWLPRDRRYTEKLATPDITIADLVGEVDPIKVAEGRYLADESTIHFGLIPRANRGILAINELPDLAERIQVGLLNLLEERDVQVRGYTLRLPLDLMFVATANPEDYTSRGRIITPLKDRLGSQIRTHYPRTLELEIEIMRQERSQLDAIDDPDASGVAYDEPDFMLELVAQLSHLARRAPEVSQRSGVSVRVSVANLETLAANALRRAVLLQETSAAPRVSDLGALIPSTVGKIELESLSDEVPEERIVDRLIARAIHEVFGRRVQMDTLTEVVEAFDSGLVIRTGEAVPSREYVRWMRETPGLPAAVGRLGVGESPAAVASAVEFLLEGLHLHRKLNKDRAATGGLYRA